jgi:hypothetical protein
MQFDLNFTKKNTFNHKKNYTKSKYKILGGFGLLLIIEFFVIICMGFLLLSFTKNNATKISFTNNAAPVFLLLTTIFFIFLLVIATECRRIIVDDEGIIFINPFLPFLKYKFEWNYFDYFITTDEHNEYDSHNAIWFIKNGKIKKRISSLYYSNYTDLLKGIKTKDNGIKEYNIYFQFLAILRIKKVD